MSSGPSTFGTMITSRALPASVTAATMSSRTHGESSELTRVHSCVSGWSQALAISTSPARALSFSEAGMASSRLARRMSTVGAMSGTLPTIFGFCGGRKWMTRDGGNGMSCNGCRRTDRQRAEEVLRGTHAGRLRSRHRDARQTLTGPTRVPVPSEYGMPASPHPVLGPLSAACRLGACPA